MADRYGRRSVLVPVLVGVAAMLAGMRCAAGLPLLFALAVGYGTLYGVAFVILPEPRRRGGAGRGAWRRYHHDGARRRSCAGFSVRGGWASPRVRGAGAERSSRLVSSRWPARSCTSRKRLATDRRRPRAPQTASDLTHPTLSGTIAAT